MQYAILIHEPESEFHKRNDPKEAQSYWAAAAEGLTISAPSTG